ncbi:TIGR01440 family protein [Cohnella faecalis]|uniref:TIGR01440 family protein n=1 Tax=Cohnella faecalis TaxID=2315694 RepID=UPI003609CE8F
MTSSNELSIADEVEQVLRELVQAGSIREGQCVVIGCSTSEVRGRHIGTSGTEEVAEQIHKGVERVKREAGFHVLWQCCEHLNRALAVERSVAERFGLTEVSAVPVAKAGGSMAAYAYKQLANPCLVESVQARAAVDIGETLIGMHLQAVAVPVRPSIRYIGQARVTMAYSRPRLIGGARAVYDLPELAESGASSHTCD